MTPESFNSKFNPPTFNFDLLQTPYGKPDPPQAQTEAASRQVEQMLQSLLSTKAVSTLPHNTPSNYILSPSLGKNGD